MIQLVQASTYFQLATLAAMVDSGLLPPADRRVLVLAGGSQVPEITLPLRESPGFELLAARFDDVVDLAELLWPRRCQQFNPRNEELPLFESLLRHRWGLGDGPVGLVLESIQVNPARALARIFFDAPIAVHSDGLMSYGPTRSTLPLHMLQRLQMAIHIDLVPGLEPLLLLEAPVERRALHLEQLAAIFAELALSLPPGQLEVPAGAALVLGQYLGSLGILDTARELELHTGMLLAARDAGAETVVFKPHPSAGPTAARLLHAKAHDLGLDFRILETPLLAETVIELARPRVVISCFSTALLSARYMLGVPVLAVGTTELLQDLSPYQNSNRIPLSIVDALLVSGLEPPALALAEAGAGDDELGGLLRAVAYCMQHENLPGLRAGAAEFLERHYPRYSAHFKRKRLAALDLPPRWAHPPQRTREQTHWARRIRSRAVAAGAGSLSRLARTLEEASRRVSG
ncbi:polysialyltransferase family glycosyltransferase [Paeniglutamicibacter sp. R2-26]|uniref:polysialyltransferase family glycosyltransferase n=1 Tax=Paeniglutamicibacter sp. R2-26 TaxID=3144417 RepID=UPI003EE58C1A